MSQSMGPRRVAQVMLSWLGLELVSHEELQALWAGYGSICALKARPINASVALPASWRPFCMDDTVHLILKFVSPAGSAADEDEGHLRKMLSYEVEQYFYDEVAPRLGAAPVARCLASTRRMRQNAVADGIDGLTATIMSDLRLEFPVSGEKRSTLSRRQVLASIEWLSSFHAASWEVMPTRLPGYFVQPPLEEAKRRKKRQQNSDGAGEREGSALWLNGGYTYLATRRREYDSLACDGLSEWNIAFCSPAAEGSPESVAEMVARFLMPSGRPFETYIHGDVKSENLFSTQAEDRVAFYDFQYVGIGLGACDLAKLFTCSVPLSMLTTQGAIMPNTLLPMDDGEKSLLEQYQTALMSRRLEKTTFAYDWDVFVRHWETALVDWCRFQASWGFWGNTGWLQARVRSILKDEGWRDWLAEELQDA